MRLITRSKKPLALFTLAPLAAAAALTFGVALPAQAATQDSSIDAVTVSPTNPAQGTQVVTDVHFDIPAGARSGDTVTLVLSDHLKNLPGDFVLYDKAGTDPIANAHVDSTVNPGVVTFTLLSYVDTHLDVSGDAYISSDFESTTTPSGQPTPFTSTLGDGTKSFTTVVTPTGAVQPPGSADTYGVFTRPDNGRIRPDDFLVYNSDTPENPAPGSITTLTLNTDTSTDAAHSGSTAFHDCTTDPGAFQYLSGTVNPTTGNLENLTPIVPTKIDCSMPGMLQVTWPNTPVGSTTKYRVTATVDETNPVDGVGDALTYAATGTYQVTVNGPSISTAALNKQSSAGGSLLGVNPLATLSISKGDTAGNAADTDATAATIPSAGSTGLVYTVTNTGQQPLTNLAVSDQVVANGTVSGLSCDFSALTGAATATTFAGVLPVGASFSCTSQLTGVSSTGEHHHDVATVTATGVTDGATATASNDYYAVAAAAAIAPAAAAPAAPVDAELAFTGSNPTVPLGIAALLLAFGAGILVIGRRRHVER